jgi:hypothetical protein
MNAPRMNIPAWVSPFLVVSMAVLMVAIAVHPAAAARYWSVATLAKVDCKITDTTPQICDPGHTQKVSVRRGATVHVRRLRYTAATTHCSSGRLLIYLDGKRVGRTDWVDAGQDTTVENLNLTLKRRANGKPHRFVYKAQGRLGGCNAGFVGSWAGDIKLIGTRS